MKDYLKAIENVRKELGRKMQPPASESEIAELVKKAKQKFNTSLPQEYLDFLRIYNGLDFNGLTVYASKTTPIAGNKDRLIPGLMEANENWRQSEDDKKRVFFADDDMSLYCLNMETKTYEEQDKSCADVLTESPTLEELLVPSMKVRLDQID